MEPATKRPDPERVHAVQWIRPDEPCPDPGGPAMASAPTRSSRSSVDADGRALPMTEAEVRARPRRSPAA